MRLGWFDRAGSGTRRVYWLPRGSCVAPGGFRLPESRADYARRFFREIEGLGNACIVTLRGNRTTVRARRGL